MFITDPDGVTRRHKSDARQFVESLTVVTVLTGYYLLRLVTRRIFLT